MMNETSEADVEKIKEQLRQSIDAENRWKSTIWENLFSVIGLVIVIIASIYLYNASQSVSQSIQELAPTREVAELNINRIGIVLGISGIETTTAFGFLGLGIAIMAFGIAWASYRSSNRNTKILIYTTGLVMEGMINVISAVVKHFDSRLDNKQNSSSRIKPKSSKTKSTTNKRD